MSNRPANVESLDATELIYKIVPKAEWIKAMRVGSYAGSEKDLADGYIHLSARHQVLETATKHFAGREDLTLVTVDATALGDGLKWEKSRGGDLFPHLYGEFPLSAATVVQPLPQSDGHYCFPEPIT